MATLTVSNDKLLSEVLSLGHHSSVEETVDIALHEYRRLLKRRQLVAMAGQVDYLDESGTDSGSQPQQGEGRMEKRSE